MADNTLLVVGAVALGGYLLLNKQTAAPIVNAVSNAIVPGSAAPTPVTVTAPTVIQPATTYPYLLANSPLPMPPVYNDVYYLTYIRSAMVVANSNVNNPAYTLSDLEAAVYMANYTDVAQWANNTGPQGGARHQSPTAAAQYHWHTYGVPDQRTFLVLPWNDPANWIPPPVNAKSSGGGVFGTILKVATLIGGTVAVVASAGALAPIVIPATTAAISAESNIMAGAAVNQLNDVEVDLVITSAAIIKKILPYYLEVNPNLVASIENMLDGLISDYAN